MVEPTYAARVIADSVTPNGVGLTTFEVTFPRMVLAEFNTHRVFSRNSASSRAIPVEKRIASVVSSPFVPDVFGANKRGMQAGEALDHEANEDARAAWLCAMECCVAMSRKLADGNVHKQWANRLTETFSWHTAIVTSTEWENYFALRAHPDAQPEIRIASEMMREAKNKSVPELLLAGELHLPMFGKNGGFEEDYDTALSMIDRVRVSAARCARVSCLTHDGRRDIDADLAMYNKLASAGHMSPLEHPARVSEYLMRPMGHQLAIGGNQCIRCGQSDVGYEDVCPAPVFVGNFRAPWVQHRKTIPNEDVFRG